MPIITQVEARSRWVRFVYLCMYIILAIGAVSMIYPMLLMVSGSLKSETDIINMTPWPKYFFDDKVLYQKYMESRYSGQIIRFQQAHKSGANAWRMIDTPVVHVKPALVNLLAEFRKQCRRQDWQYMGYSAGPSRMNFKNARRFQTKLEKHFGTIDKLNMVLKSDYTTFLQVSPPNESMMPSRRYRAGKSIFFQIFNQFKMSLPPEQREFIDLDGYYQLYYVKPVYSTIRNYNEKHHTQFASFHDIYLSANPPKNEQRKKDWEKFVRKELGLVFIRIDKNQADSFREFLKTRYHNVRAINRLYQTHYKKISDIPFSETVPEKPIVAADWDLFLQNTADLRAIKVYGPRQAFEEYVKNKGFPSLKPDAMTRAGIALELQDFHKNKKQFFRDCLKRNYLIVLDYILLHGRGIVNTVIYCGLMILGMLLVNPLAAYAMSRYKLPSTYKILLFCMLTMAFPPAVTMIPAFLLLRNLHLLNTFAALILPTVANGYWIFMLKGFFDSLPQELYEAADIDGASEWKKFWVITMSLSKPVLAVISLQAFTMAYSNFMAALIIIPDKKMWTLMIWLYELQTQSQQGIIYAALCLAAIPTLLIFLFAQNIIMRGIVVPVEK